MNLHTGIHRAGHCRPSQWFRRQRTSWHSQVNKDAEPNLRPTLGGHPQQVHLLGKSILHPISSHLIQFNFKSIKKNNRNQFNLKFIQKIIEINYFLLLLTFNFDSKFVFIFSKINHLIYFNDLIKLLNFDFELFLIFQKNNFKIRFNDFNWIWLLFFSIIFQPLAEKNASKNAEMILDREYEQVSANRKTFDFS